MRAGGGAAAAGNGEVSERYEKSCYYRGPERGEATAPPAPSCLAFRTEAKPALSEFGKRVKTVVVVGLGGGPVCQSRTSDWRANLPKILGAYAHANVIVYNPRKRICYHCYAQRKDRKVPCEERMERGVDVLAFDRLREDCQLQIGMPARRKMVPAAVPLVNNKVFNFDVIIDDGSFAKPPGRCAVAALEQCEGTPKQKKLVYVGRIMSSKGQLEFVRQADAKLLKGYKIELIGRLQNPTYGKTVKRLALEKGIAVSFLGEVSKELLAKHMCQAQGIIMYSMDKNPRSVYEGVQAGLPVFVSSQAKVAPTLSSEPFVFEVSRSASQATFDEQLAEFMAVVKSGDSSTRIQEWAHSKLTMDSVFSGLCQRMGVCKDGEEKYDPWLGRER
eukprot:jgi/Tetstr1/456391/TSEL_043125.t1